jgi:hypothetical protein
LHIEVLFDDPIVVVAGLHSLRARRRKIDLAELAAFKADLDGWPAIGRLVPIFDFLRRKSIGPLR